MLEWEYWMWPSVAKAIESFRTHAFAKNDEVQMKHLQTQRDEMDKQVACIHATVDTQFCLHNLRESPARTVCWSGDPPRFLRTFEFPFELMSDDEEVGTLMLQGTCPCIPFVFMLISPSRAQPRQQ